jgi:hypothetical protein
MKRTARYHWQIAAAAVFFVCLVFVICVSARAEGRGQPVVELRNNGDEATASREFRDQPVAGTEQPGFEEYKFQRERQGHDFSYAVANLEPAGS